MSELVNKVAEILNAPVDLVQRSAEARAQASGISVDEVLNSWAGGESVATSAPKEEAPVEEAPEEEVKEEARMSIDEWMAFLTDAKLLYVSETEKIEEGFKVPGYVDELQARLRVDKRGALAPPQSAPRAASRVALGPRRARTGRRELCACGSSSCARSSAAAATSFA